MTFPNTKDDPVALDADFRAGVSDRRKIDNQILAVQDALFATLLGGATAARFLLDAGSAALARGDAFCTTSNGSVTRGVSAALAASGGPVGIAVEAATPGAAFYGAAGGVLAPALTGLAAGALSAVRVNPTTARLERATLTPVDYAAGIATTDGSVTFAPVLVGGVPATGGPPTGAAAGDLTGTYPNPSVVNITLPSAAQGDTYYRSATTLTRLPPGTAGQSLVTAGAAANPSWSAVDLANAASVTGVLPTAKQAAQTLAGSLGGTTAAATVVAVDGTGGTAPVNAARVVWSSAAATGRGTESIEGTIVTTTNAANQTLATLSTATGGPPIDTIFGYVVRVIGRDTAAAGMYYAEWRDVFERRTGVSSGNAVRQGVLPTVQGEVRTGTLAAASIDMLASTNDVLLRGSPGATANVKWTWEIIALRDGV